MDVGVISNGSFDIDAVGETDAVLIRNDGETKWLYKNELNELVILQKTEALPQVIPKGTLLKICEVSGYAKPVVDINLSSDICGKLSVDLNWENLEDFHSKTITHEGVSRLAALVPVILSW